MYDVPAGDMIPGSRFYRAYCERCGEPMRVNASERDYEHYCEECGPKRPDDLSKNLTPRQRDALKKTRS